MSFGRKSIKVWVFLAREETQRSAFLWHAGRMKEELSGVMRMSRLWRSGDFLIVIPSSLVDKNH